MASTFQIEIATPEKLVVSQQADSAQIPRARTAIWGILPGHAALLSELNDRRGAVVPAGRADRSRSRVSGGYVEVRDDHVRVLTDKAE